MRSALVFLMLLTACDGGSETAEDKAETTDAAASEDGAATADVEVPPQPPPPKEIPAPADVAAPPADAKKTESGLAYKVLEKGTGTEKPSKSAKVTVHYTGWTTDGKMFDSSVTRGREASFPLNQVIAGWTEGLQLMVVGDKVRFWIPEELAYQGKPGKPAGMLVFDVELKSFDEPPPAPADVAAPPADAKKLPSGLAYKVLQEGTGAERPAEDATVTVHFTGWTVNGDFLQSTQDAGRPAVFPLERAIPGWQQAIPLMKKGEKARFWIPADLAKVPGAPEGDVVFEFELLDFKNPPPPIPAPADVAAPPADAKKTESGLAYKVLQKGTGTEHPKAEQTVEVHYTGWTTDGKMFDSSVQRGTPSKFALNRVIPGWTEGVQLMVKGEKTRFWIPEELAYKGKPGAPQGMLVFDVELIDVVAAPALGGDSPH